MRSHAGFRSNRFADRAEAGRLLANALLPVVAGTPRTGLLVLGLARGGVVVAAEVAAVLGASLDACVVRKIGSPLQPELAIGAVGPGGVRVFNRTLIRDLGLSQQVVEQLTTTVEGNRNDLDERLRDGRPLPGLHGKTVILVDDGLATGASMRAALEFARQSAGAVLIAVPTASPDVIASFERSGTRSIALVTPRNFRSVGLWYDRFEEVTSAEVRTILAGAAETGRSAP